MCESSRAAAIVDFSIQELTDVNSDVFYSRITDYVAFMGYTILLWDHAITFNDEVRFVWMNPKSLTSYLFFLNRYFTPLAFIGNLIAYYAQWSTDRCDHFVRYEGSCTIIAVEMTALMMLMRVRALYKGRSMIIGSVILLLALETAVNIWLMTRAQPVHHPSAAVKACTMIFDPELKFWPSLSALLPLLYDTYVIVLTLHACMPVRHSTASNIVKTLMKDGLAYYSVIFCVNFALAIMIISAKDEIKNIAAQLEQLLTVAMISRISLSLRREGARRRYRLNDDEALDDHFVYSAARPHPRARPLKHGAAGSATVHQHISVVPVSNRTSLLSSQGHKRWASRVKGVRGSGSSGTVSFGVLSISPAHSQEAAAAAAAGLSVPVTAVITGPSQLSEQNAYELRTLRRSDK